MAGYTTNCSRRLIMQLVLFVWAAAAPDPRAAPGRAVSRVVASVPRRLQITQLVLTACIAN